MLSGLLVIDKPAGLSSHDVVAAARKLFHQQRIGHGGTLDPLATGVLVLCLGQATRLSEYVMGEQKAYLAVARLGVRTITDDMEGSILQTRPVPPVDQATLRALEHRFTGELQQVPPQFSAIKREGQRAYTLARRGEAIELEPRRVFIHALQLTLLDAERVQMEVLCSAGTYIRALARDIGEALGCGAHVESLRRTRSGAFTLDQALSLDRLRDMDDAARAASLLPMDRAVAHWPAVQISAAQAHKLRQGQRVTIPSPMTEGRYRVYDERERFCAIGRIVGAYILIPEKVFDADSA
ncbi:MAG: tRNA pseudouridine(55) synthase TruB [Thermoflexales bacterium]